MIIDSTCSFWYMSRKCQATRLSKRNRVAGSSRCQVQVHALAPWDKIFALILENLPPPSLNILHPVPPPHPLPPHYLSPPPPSTSASSGTTLVPTMPLINSPTLIRSFALIHLTTAYYLLTAPARIVNHSFVAILGVSMGLVRCPFPK